MATRGGRDRGPGRQPRAEEPSSARVIVRLREAGRIPEDWSDEALQHAGFGGWQALTERIPGLTLRRVFTALPPEGIRELQARAAEVDRTYEPPDLLAYFQVDAPVETDLDALAKEIDSWPDVETAYVDRDAPDPVVNAGDDPRSAFQGYLDPAPDGIDAEFAWTVPGGDGAGQRVIDLERGWTFGHEDLTAHGAALLHGTLLDSSRSHGTSVLGQICAVDNTLGCVGIVPAVAQVDAVSFHGSSRPNAVLAAVATLGFGDVLILEAQVYLNSTLLLGPIEAYDAEYEAIRLATALGIIVVEAGGNGWDNGSTPPLAMDTYTNPAGRRIFDPTSADFRDSGAIIVTAASSTAPHTRLPYAPHGARVDCYAWGQGIDTCASNTSGATNLYTGSFGGTSGATPIVTGAALAVQGMSQARPGGYRLSPRQMRKLLGDPARGTPPAATETTAIGVMPDLAEIAGVLGVRPDIYVRDFVGDTGDPHTGPIASSPDVILRRNQVANPQASFGAGSGTAGDDDLSTRAETGQDNFVYVRCRNRGGGAASNAEATVFWSPPATLVTPNLWHLVGTGTFPTVPTGGALTVSNEIRWDSSDVPGPGHYCFVALVGAPRDPVPGPAAFGTWENFTRFIRENNNVTWRNFDVRDNDPEPDPSAPEGFNAFEFLIAGAHDRARPFALELIAQLPEGAEVILEAPLELLRRFRELPGQPESDRESKRAWLRLPPSGKHWFGEAVFPAKSAVPARLLVAIPEEAREAPSEVAIRQLWEREEVGRLTWRLQPGVRARDAERDPVDRGESVAKLRAR